MHFYFILPKISRYPIGGYKMVYEYANRLCADNHEVTIVHLNEDFMKKYKLPKHIRSCISYLFTIIEPKWMTLDRRIKKTSIMDTMSTDQQFAGADYAVATAAQTVGFTEKHFKCPNAYYIQGFEDWGMGKEELYNTYKNDMRKIVISQWLKEIVDKYSPEQSFVIRNPIDTTVYRICRQFSERRDHTISLLYNELPTKGFEYALKAIEFVHNKYPDLQVYMFGRKGYPAKLPDWVKYTKNASQKQTVRIYNDSKVFLCASIEEGFGLTGLEAMSCGSVLVTTDFLGAREYAVNGYNALVSPVKDYEELAHNIIRVFEDKILARRLSENGVASALDYSWDIAKDRFIYAITGKQGTY